MKPPSFSISVNSKHLATIGVPGSGVCSCIIGWTDRSDAPTRKDGIVRIALGGLDRDRQEFVDWPGGELRVGDTVVIHILDSCESLPTPERRPLETIQDAQKKKEYVRQAAQELGWTILEP